MWLKNMLDVFDITDKELISKVNELETTKDVDKKLKLIEEIKVKYKNILNLN